MESIKIKTKYKLKTLLTATGLLLLLNANDGTCCLFRSKRSKSSKDLVLNPLKGYESGYESEEEIKARPYRDKKRDSSSHFPNNNIALIPGHSISSNNNDKAVKTNHSPASKKRYGIFNHIFGL